MMLIIEKKLEELLTPLNRTVFLKYYKLTIIVSDYNENKSKKFLIVHENVNSDGSKISLLKHF
jgi:hypothetical protein